MKTYLVGGAVRDKLLGYPVHERDWVVVGATAEQLLAQGYQAVGKDFPVFLHPQTKEEYALARTERKTAPGYTGFECFASPDVTLEQDLLRRDLTVNAMAEDSDGSIIDPYGGRQDLAQKLLRHVSPAFTEDPLRVLRVARFSARYAHLGFTVAEETLALMQQISAGDELQSLPVERIWKELHRALGEQSPRQFFAVLDRVGALPALLPELGGLSPAILQTLDDAARQQQPPAICFAVLFIDIDPQQAKQCCQRIKAPKAFSELAQLVSQYARLCADICNDAEQLLTLLKQLDAFRRPQRFADFLQCCELLFKHNRSKQQLQQALDRCIAIDTASIIAQGIKGRNVATELQRQRQRALQQMIAEQHREQQ